MLTKILRGLHPWSPFPAASSTYESATHYFKALSSLKKFYCAPFGRLDHCSRKFLVEHLISLWFGIKFILAAAVSFHLLFLSVCCRLGLQRMKNIRSLSTMWRATCNFPIRKSNILHDYVRAQLQVADILTYKEETWTCMKVDYINIRGHIGRNVTVPFWQKKDQVFHTDSSLGYCTFNAKQGSIYNEDNFGLYAIHNKNFTCTESNSSTTQLWMGTSVYFNRSVIEVI